MAAEVFCEQEEEFSNGDHEHSFEAEETLSLSDLPLHSDDDAGAAHWADFSTGNQTSSSWSSSPSSPEEEDFFEFTGGNVAIPTLPAENIIFCGKLLSCREPLPGPVNNHDSRKEPAAKRKLICSSRAVSTASSPSISEGRSSPRVSSSSPPRVEKGSKVLPLKKHGCGDSRKLSSGYKATVMAYPISKSKGYLLMSGFSKFPMEKEVKDIKWKEKNKQNISSKRLLQSPDGVKDVKVSGRSKEKGLWRTIGAVSCKTFNPNSMVQASFVSLPRT